MYELAPTASGFLVAEGSHLARVLLLGGVCGWMAHRLVGLNLNLTGLRIFFGLAGLWTGSWLWHSLSFHPGPMIADVSLPASFAGALFLFAVLKLVEVAIAAAGTT